MSNLPPGVTTSMIPRNRPEDELAEAIAYGWRPHCKNCGGFLTIAPERTQSVETTGYCEGGRWRDDDWGGYEDRHEQCKIIGEHSPHYLIVYLGTNLYRTCRKCGTSNIEATF